MRFDTQRAVFARALEYEFFGIGDKMSFALQQRGVFLSEFSECTVVFKQIGILSSPRIRSAIEGVFVALLADFVAVENTWYTGKRILQRACKFKPALGKVVLLV